MARRCCTCSWCFKSIHTRTISMRGACLAKDTTVQQLASNIRELIASTRMVSCATRFFLTALLRATVECDCCFVCAAVEIGFHREFGCGGVRDLHTFDCTPPVNRSRPVTEPFVCNRQRTVKSDTAFWVGCVVGPSCYSNFPVTVKPNLI